MLPRTLRRLEAFLLSRSFPVVCLVAAVLVRVLWMLLVDPKPVSDFDWYYTRAIDISLGHGYQYRGAPTAAWPVGYPAFLGALFAVFGHSLLVAKIANLALSVGIILLTSWMAGRLFRSALTARLTMLVLSFYPNHIAYTSLVASEPLSMFLIMLGIGFLLIERSRLLMTVLAGASFGLSCLVRPQGLPIPLILVLLPRSGLRPFGGRLLSVACVYAALLLVLVPWTIRNYKAFGGVFLVSTNGGGNLLIGNNPWANGTYRVPPHYDSMLSYGGNEYERDRESHRLAVEYIRTHPVEILKLLPKKVWYLYRGDVEGIRWSFEGIEAKGERVPAGPATAIVALAEAYYLVLFAACAMSCILFVKSLRSGRDVAFSTMGLGVLVYFTFLGLVFYGGSRYHFPVMPFVAMYAAWLPEALRTVGR